MKLFPVVLLTSLSLFNNSYALAVTNLKSLHCIAFKYFGYVSTPKFNFNLKMSLTNQNMIEMGAFQTIGANSKIIVIELVDQDDSSASFQYNNYSVILDKKNYTAVVSLPDPNGYNLIYASCSL